MFAACAAGIGWVVASLSTAERAWLAVANAVTFGWHGRIEQRPPLRPCIHRGAVPVEDLAGETVAHLCADCGEQLSAEWKISLTDLFFDPNLISKKRR